MFAFVLMPFDSSFDDVYRLGVKETCEKLGITAERVDEQIFYKEDILQRIYQQILAADFIIADMTGRNPNVFYETGYAHGKGKTCLLLTSNVDDIPFDLKHHRHLVYGNSIQNLRLALERDLAWIKSEIENRQSAISVDLVRTDGLLQKTKYVATGEVDLYFDFSNKTGAASPEIEAIYFHTGKGWKFEQNGQPCSSTKSDVGDYPLKHFVQVPIKRLSAGGWAQIKLSGKKTVATAFKGEVLLDSYRMVGRAQMRIITSDGAFDYPLNIDVEVTEFPF